MKESDISKVVNKIQITPSIKNNVLNYLLSHESDKKLRRNKKICIIAVVVLAFGIVCISDIIKINENITGDFIITAYAQNGKEVTLSQNVEVLLSEYSVWMNSAIGYPIRIEYDNANGDLSNEIDEIQIIAEEGKIFNEKNEEAEYQNNKYICHNGDTIYWTPIIDNVEKYNSDFTMKIFAVKNDKVIEQTEVIFISNKDPNISAWSAKINNND